MGCVLPLAANCAAGHTRTLPPEAQCTKWVQKQVNKTARALSKLRTDSSAPEVYSESDQWTDKIHEECSCKLTHLCDAISDLGK